MGAKKISIRNKLIVSFLGVGMLPLLVSSIITYKQSAKEIEKLAEERARIVAEGKSKEISSYFAAEANSIVDLAADPSILEAFKNFNTPFARDINLSADQEQFYKAQILSFYSDSFGGLYYEKTKSKLEASRYVNKLDALSLVAQYDFIVANENPLGSKDKMVTPKRDSFYARTHEKYHPFLREYLVRHSLYDLFLVAPNGRIVYSVFKETDFSTSLKHGPWADTSIAKTFEASKNLKPGEVHIEDFAAYTPSYEAPASFAATPIYENGEYVGSLMIQLPLDKISAIAGNRDGLGEQGETLLLGSDLKLRADTYRNKSSHNVAASFAPGSQISVESEAVLKAKTGEAGFRKNISYDGVETLAYYLPLKIQNLTWYVVVELAQSEVFAGLKNMTTWITATVILAMSLIAFIAYFFGSGIAQSLKQIVSALENTTRQLKTASAESTRSASELSDAATEQASSLQETMASAEEISAMVSQNADSAAKAEGAVSMNKQVSQDGTESVRRMIHAFNDIKSTNDEIMHQMEESNKEFGEIVKIISNIGEKTNVINDIVFQTKLLSFNASVEAARAGEHGKGFAVVAEEVGNLAQMSGSAAKEISDMLGDSIKKVNGIVENTRTRIEHLMEVGKDKIAMSQSTAEQCELVLKKINENAKSIAGMITEIANASKEQSQGVQEINKAIAQLDKVTQQNSVVAQRSSEQATQLNSEAEELNNTVGMLVEFVDGDMQGAADVGASGSHGNWLGLSHNKNRARSLIKETLFTAKKSKRQDVVAHNTPTAIKKAAGADFTPSSEDSGFENF